MQRNDTGRPEIVYGRRSKDLEHEIRIAELELLLNVRITRDVKVNKAEPDGLIERDGERCFVEVDNSGKMNAKQMKDKWVRFGRIEGFILVVALTESRMQRLIKWAELVKDVALFTTFERLREGKPGVDWYGKTVEI